MNKFRNIKFLSSATMYDEMDSPVGALTIVANSQGLLAILWDIDKENFQCEKIISTLHYAKNEKIIMETKKQLTEYFAGSRKIFDLPLMMHGTDFQIQVWRQLQKIPYSKTISYGEQAERLGDKKKARAVGAANGLNPFSIIVPCHRVVGKNGQLVGFGGGLDKKAYLLKLEQG